MFWLNFLIMAICVFCQQSVLSEEGSSSPAGVKLEAVMEQLQRQQEAKLEMNLQEKQLLQAQLLFAQHAATARAAGARLTPALFGKADGQAFQDVQQALNIHLGKMDPGEDDGDTDDEEREMVEHDEMDEDEDDDDDEDGEEENGPRQQAKKPRLQQVPGFPFRPYPTSQAAAVKPMSGSSPPAVKQEREEKDMSSPVGQHAFTSPNGFTDWGYDEPFKQVSYLSFKSQRATLRIFSFI